MGAVRQDQQPRLRRIQLTVLRVAIALLSLGLSLELITRVAYSIPAVGVRLVDADSASWRRLWVLGQAQNRPVMQRFDRFDAAKGWSTLPNYQGTHWDKRSVTTNSLGLRGAKEWRSPKPAGEFRIAVLGDSFTFGEEVGDREVYAHLMDQELGSVEVLNLGVHGYGHDQMSILFEELAPTIEPDVVVLGFFRMDMARNLLSFRGYAKPYFDLAPGGGLQLRGVPVPSPDEIMRSWRWRPRVLDVLSLARYRVAHATGTFKEQRREVTKRVLAELGSRIAEAQARALFVYLPSLPEIHRKKGRRLASRFLAENCPSSEHVRCTDARPDFDRARARGAKFRSDGHWGPVGHQVAADAIVRMLDESDWLPESGERRRHLQRAEGAVHQ